MAEKKHDITIGEQRKLPTLEIDITKLKARHVGALMRVMANPLGVEEFAKQLVDADCVVAVPDNFPKGFDTKSADSWADLDWSTYMMVQNDVLFAIKHFF